MFSAAQVVVVDAAGTVVNDSVEVEVDTDAAGTVVNSEEDVEAAAVVVEVEVTVAVADTSVSVSAPTEAIVAKKATPWRMMDLMMSKMCFVKC